MARVGETLWEPSREWIEQSNLEDFQRWLARERGLRFDSLYALWRWSVDSLDDFWQAIWDYFGIEASTPARAVLGRREMPGADWFPGARLNYAQHILRRERPGPALLYASEKAPLRELDWHTLAGNVRTLATRLR